MSGVHTVLATVAGAESLSIKVLEKFAFLRLLHQHLIRCRLLCQALTEAISKKMLEIKAYCKT